MNAVAAPLVESRLPDWIEPRFFRSVEELFQLAPEAEIGWFDLNDKEPMAKAIRSATKLKWLNSIYAGVDAMPLDLLRERGVVLTNGVGINAITIAEYVVMGMLTVAKGYREVVRAQERHEWLMDSPGKVELHGSRALVLGYGAIGQRVERMLQAFDVDVAKVRRSGGAGALGPDEWRSQLGTFDWVILAVPATAETEGMIGAAELAAMKPTATLINVARGTVVDQEALVVALSAGRPGQAFLDVTSPEPLPADHPLWSLPNAHVTMHLSGRAQTRMFERSVARFLENLARFRRGEPLEPQVDLALGY
ncbi:D-isomer specific 2-hydroxyacid dehydrogenase, NAD-binding protein [Novosphingobium aromaticivorans DSM 12444]|uniref:D-isomer specific 2-hydroxyacid dehydrogenase, NAD-binding protein n=1 Tax=Novosphingobium aromaticivorans (strain ATCC 700278 / DSM 12444 / CCUG 56034 / CIP 105152 / NBRC 16084 / F199) TaxID=279238 RepID=Q2G5Q7_NOVAD|nr:D-isomer specific 2-hydroxyacid dehydrogenase, NAD-binding protein [Novosphingobium aromaticivorans DSM 12444]SCY42885.1 Phosphoglycerate dehydrogenase [Novosphingobium aromaticivorans]